MKRLFLTSVAAETLKEFVKILPKLPKDYTVAFIPTAADPYENKSFVEEDRSKLLELGFKVVDVDIKEKTEEQLLDELAGIDIIFVAGGNTFYLLEKSIESGFGKIVKNLVEQGVMYIGSSAGSVLVGPTLEPIQTLDDPKKAPNLKSFTGLNIVDFVVLPHFGIEKYKEKQEEILEEYKDKVKIITLTDKQAILIEGNNQTIL
ncbi:MAG: Type 1 glutamine amidotransferase-like domain-containing protein [Nanoarchaeota archaeon]|nr:Type 1 glutamine amidotransferase-like domain-containing protein [Nanoarchaeota archaeon]MBU1321317.1 Type 1 glutamine amidotransferase-like domain-containing protein [Nanoarchaeota archaeon]MBU1597524.1 Type 1 glutamine amidotransferase-like domain-containing protein [Nanoarchaeota archaeon]MBU2441135.1 Type 1 glutamine amidotransferase-like domain-containing protein [Nanoarchaeota archaeon]